MKKNSYIHLIIDSIFILILIMPFISYMIYMKNVESLDNLKSFNDFILINDNTFLSGKVCVFISNLFNILYKGLIFTLQSVFNGLSINNSGVILNAIESNYLFNFSTDSIFLYCANVVFFKIIFYIVDMIFALLTLPGTFSYVESD